MKSYRLAPQSDEWINRQSKVQFFFEGKEISCFEGDTITSALAASGLSQMGRSFKYHRSRGILSLANHDANILVQTDKETNIRADITSPINGAHYRAVNTFGGLTRDYAHVIEKLAPFLPVGFYYKAFYKPRILFPYWEKLIRNLAGLGKVSENHTRYRKPIRSLFCDILVVGGGPSGIAAANSLADSGKKVVLADENRHLGGSGDFTTRVGSPEHIKLKEQVQKLQRSTTNILCAHYAAGFYDDNTVPLIGMTGITLVHAKSVILATGAYEQPAIFRNNDLPGVILSSAVSRLVNRYSVMPFSNPVIIAGNQNGYEVAANLAARGLKIQAILDLENADGRGEVGEKVEKLGIDILSNITHLEAIGGEGKVKAIKFSIGESNKLIRLNTDGIIMSVGWSPAINLLKQAGGDTRYSDEVNQLEITRHPDGIFTAGKIRGIYSVEGRIKDGESSADECLKYLNHNASTFNPILSGENQNHAYPIFHHTKGKEFVDFDEDLTIKDIKTSLNEGFDSVELLKRFTTLGMGPSQGKTSSMNGNRIMAKFLGTPIATVGTTTPRPFVHPVPIGHLAGQRIRKQKRTPVDDYHRHHNANMKEAGAWVRPMAYNASSSQEQILIEYQAVREKVGIIDVSTLGKIEIFGPDATKLLEYAYTCKFDKLKIGMTRYIFMVDASGTLVDDGVAAKLSEQHYYFTTTTTHSHTVIRQLHLFVEQLKLNVEIIDRTNSVGAFNLAGPKSKALLSAFTETELDQDTFPYLGIRTAIVAGVEARLMRVGFVGELGYEIHLPYHSMADMWETLVKKGQEFRIHPFGVEAQRLLRLEKGHLIFGQDTDGNTNPFEVGLGWGVNLKKEQFFGKHSLKYLKDVTKRKLVGFKCDLAASNFLLENHLVIENSQIMGRITSVGQSPTLDRTIGLAMLEEDLEEGEVISIKGSRGNTINAHVTTPSFYDPKNERQNV